MSATSATQPQAKVRAANARLAAEARYSASETRLADVLTKRRERNVIQLRNLQSLEEVLKAWRNLATVVSSAGRN